MDRPVTGDHPAAAWVREHLAELLATEERLFSASLDFLVGKSYVEPWNLDVACEAFLEAVAAVDPEAAALHMVGLAIPLADAPELDTRAMDLADLDLSEFEPPKIYLLRRLDLAGHSDVETYALPLEAPVWQAKHGTIRAHYACTRDPCSRSHGWEFARTLWYRHYTY